MTMSTDPATLRAFITSGRAVFTMTSRETGTRFTYKVRAVRDFDGSRLAPPRFFVSILTGPDNTADYQYAGMLFADTDGLTFRATRGSKVTDNAASWRGFAWLTRMLNREQDPGLKMEMDAEGRCGRCGRALTVPESVRTGLGPECVKKAAG